MNLCFHHNHPFQSLWPRLPAYERSGYGHLSHTDGYAKVRGCFCLVFVDVHAKWVVRIGRVWLGRDSSHEHCQTIWRLGGSPRRPIVVEAREIVNRGTRGQTTLLQILGTLDLPTNGDVIIDSTSPPDEPTELSQFQNKNLGLCFSSISCPRIQCIRKRIDARLDCQNSKGEANDRHGNCSVTWAWRTE